jgi:hypothetical protein
MIIHLNDLEYTSGGRYDPTEEIKANCMNYWVWAGKTKSNCLHDNCLQCNGTGVKKDGLGPCVHMISCKCSRCGVKL